MKRVRTVFYGFILALTMGLFSGCAVGVVATYPVGPGYYAPGPPPFVGAIWIGGEYRWVGGHYVMQGGYWAHPHRGRAWMPGRWAPTRGGYVWRHGYWR